MSEQQQSIPGINRHQYAYDAILKENPCPTTVEEANVFFRKYCIATITIAKQLRNVDYLRVVLKDTDQEENKEKHEYSTQLEIDDKEARAKAYVEVAEKVHAAWLDLIGPKYTGK